MYVLIYSINYKIKSPAESEKARLELRLRISGDSKKV